MHSQTQFYSFTFTHRHTLLLAIAFGSCPLLVYYKDPDVAGVLSFVMTALVAFFLLCTATETCSSSVKFLGKTEKSNLLTVTSSQSLVYNFEQKASVLTSYDCHI